MADIKISQMAAAAALSGTELVPVVQAGASRRATVAAFKAGLGLTNVDNTADSAKPVSGPQQAALDALEAAKVDKVAGLGLSSNDYTSAEQAKLAGVAEGATQNATNAQLRDRATHTGSQAIATVTGLQEVLDGLASSGSGGGAAGTDGREVELQKTATHIQWRYVGTLSWTDLVALSSLQGIQGIQGIQGPKGDPGDASAPETVFTLTGTTPVIAPANGTIQTWTLSANSTPTLGAWAAGEGVAVQVAYGTFTVSWPVAITWLTPSGLAPDPSKYAGKTLVIALYKIGSTIFGVGGQ